MLIEKRFYEIPYVIIAALNGTIFKDGERAIVSEIYNKEKDEYYVKLVFDDSNRSENLFNILDKAEEIDRAIDKAIKTNYSNEDADIYKCFLLIFSKKGSDFLRKKHPEYVLNIQNVFNEIFVYSSDEKLIEERAKEFVDFVLE